MEIINNITQNGERIGVLIKDGDETYPLPMDVIKSKFYYDALQAAGYSLTEVTKPEYERDGISISRLPTVEFDTLPDGSDMIFYNAIDQYPPMSMTELYALVQKTAEYVKFREGDYTSNTQEEFLAYLDSIAKGVSDDDFMPINSFVAPSARIPLGKILGDSDMLNRLNILGRRRLYSNARFYKFVKWVMQDKGITNPTPNDIISAYMEFGLDGVNICCTAKTEEITLKNPSSPTTAAMNIKNLSAEENMGINKIVSASWQFHKLDVALLSRNRDSYEGLLFTGDLNPNDCVFPVNDEVRRDTIFADGLNPHFFENHNFLKDNEYIAEKFFIPSPQHVYKWICFDEESGDTIEVNITPTEIGIVNKTRPIGKGSQFWPNFSLRNANNFSIAVPTEKWFKNSGEYMRDIALLQEAATKMCNKTKLECKETSYSILRRMGCTPGNIIRYILNYYGALGVPQLANGLDPADEAYGTLSDDDWVITAQDITDFFRSGGDASEMVDSPYTIQVNRTTKIAEGVLGHVDEVGCTSHYGNCTAERKVKIIQEIINGERDLGRISEGHKMDEVVDTSKVFDALYAARFHLGARTDQIITDCEQFNPSNDEIHDNDTSRFSLTYNGKTIIINVPNRNKAVLASESEAFQHMYKQMMTADTFFQVIDVAREMTNTAGDGTPAPNRHVGVYGVAFDRNTYKVVNDGCSVAQEKPNSRYGKTVQDYVNQFAEDFYSYTAIKSGPAGLREGDQLRVKLLSNKAAMQLMCDIALSGKVISFTEYPEEWNNIPAEDIKRIKELSRRFYDSTLAICDELIDATDEFIENKNSDDEAHMYKFVWRYYCTNADITPMLVTPTGFNIIPETDLSALYRIGEVPADSLESTWNLLASMKCFNPQYFKSQDDSWLFCPIPLSIAPRIDINRTGSSSSIFEMEDVYSAYSLVDGSDYTDKIPELDKKFAEKGQHYENASLYSLHRYYYKSMIERDKHKAEGKFFMHSTHPADEMYPGIYSNCDNGVRDMQEGDKAYYPCHNGLLLHGPQFTPKDGDERVFGRPFREGVGASTLTYDTTSTSKSSKAIKVGGFYAEDINLCDTLVDTDFSIGTKFLVRGSAIGYDGAAHKIEEVIELPDGKYAIKHVTGNIAYICDVNNIIYRISTL